MSCGGAQQGRKQSYPEIHLKDTSTKKSCILLTLEFCPDFVFLLLGKLLLHIGK